MADTHIHTHTHTHTHTCIYIYKMRHVPERSRDPPLKSGLH